jgi:hypothetical protein
MAKGALTKGAQCPWDDGGKIELIIYEHGEWEALMVGEGGK